MIKGILFEIAGIVLPNAMIDVFFLSVLTGTIHHMNH